MGAAETTGRPADDFVQSLERGLRVITVFGEGAERLSLSEVSERAGLTRATARRFLHTLVTLGYVYTDGKYFRLGPKILELGYSYLSSFPLSELAMPPMERAVEQVKESCSLSVLDGLDVVYVARVPVKRIMSVQIHVGTRFPAYVTSMGRVFLANLPEAERALLLDGVALEQLTELTVADRAGLEAALDEVRDRDYALVRSELEPGLISIAVPVRDPHSGRVIAAMNMSAHIGSRDAAFMIEEALPQLRIAATQIETGVGAMPPVPANGSPVP